MERKEFLAPAQVSRELKGKIKAYAYEHGFRSEAAMVLQAVAELMARGGTPADPKPGGVEKGEG